MKWLLGVDVGNTKTLAVIADAAGHIVGKGRTGCGNIYSASNVEEPLLAIREAVEAALDDAGITSRELDVGGFSIAGADWPEDIDFLKSELARYGLVNSHLIANDAIGGLRTGTDGGAGVSVILGTGVAIGAKGINGEYWHGGFWVRQVGSDWLLNQIYDAVVDAEMGISVPTELTESLLAVFQITSVEQLIFTFNNRHQKPFIPKTRLIASLMDAAVDGDPAAISIANEHSRRCAQYAVYAAKKVSLSPDDTVPLVFSGGMVRHPSQLFVKQITEQIQKLYPHVRPVVSSLEPVFGALLLAFDTANIQVNQEVLKHLKQSMPEAAFFAT